MALINPLRALLLIALIGWTISSASAQLWDGERFSVSVSSNKDLVIFEPAGRMVVSIESPTLLRRGSVTGIPLEVSFVQDEAKVYTATLTSGISGKDLHFSVCGHLIDSDKNAVITLVFNSNFTDVQIKASRQGKIYVDAVRLPNLRSTELIQPPPSFSNNPRPANTTTGPRPEANPAVASTLSPRYDHLNGINGNPNLNIQIDAPADLTALNSPVNLHGGVVTTRALNPDQLQAPFGPLRPFTTPPPLTPF